MSRFAFLAGLMLATPLIAGCDGENEGVADSGQDTGSMPENRTWESIAYSNERHDFYHRTGVAILRCVARDGASCRHPYVSKKTRFMTVASGDLPGGWSYPEGMERLAQALRPHDRFEYSEHGTMPVPVDPRDPAHATIVLVNEDRSRQVSVRLTYRLGHLDLADFDWTRTRGGAL
ncbi:MAG TPA: hypothetical protein VI168_05625 [Croceibacterium sp.]